MSVIDDRNTFFDEMSQFRSEVENLEEIVYTDYKLNLYDTDSNDDNLIVDDEFKARYQNEYGLFLERIDQENDKIVEGNNKLLEIQKEFMSQYDEFMGQFQEESKSLSSENAVTSNDLESIRNQFLLKRDNESKRLLELKDEIKNLRNIIIKAKKSRDRIISDFEKAVLLGVTAEEYYATMALIGQHAKQDIMDEILRKNGYDELLKIEKSSLTSKQKKELAVARRKIREEVMSAVRENKSLSVLDTIQKIYNLDLSSYRLIGSRKMNISEESLSKMSIKASELPEEIVQGDKVRSLDDISKAEGTPEDMTIDIQTVTTLFQDLDKLLNKLLNDDLDSIKLYNAYNKYSENINKLKDIIDDFSDDEVYGPIINGFVESLRLLDRRAEAVRQRILDSVEYEEEVANQVVAEGVFFLDGLRMSEEEMKRKILLEASQTYPEIDVDHPEDYDIGFVGADTNEGYSENQETKYVITRSAGKKTPYIKSKKSITTGEYPQDMRRTDDEIKMWVLKDAALRNSDIDLDHPEKYEIELTGAFDRDDLVYNEYELFEVNRERVDSLDNVQSVFDDDQDQDDDDKTDDVGDDTTGDDDQDQDDDDKTDDTGDDTTGDDDQDQDDDDKTDDVGDDTTGDDDQDQDDDDKTDDTGDDTTGDDDQDQDDDDKTDDTGDDTTGDDDQDQDDDDKTDDNDDIKEETYILYKDLDDDGQFYAPEETLKKFGIYTAEAPIDIEGFKCYKIDKDTANDIISQSLDVDPEYINDDVPRINVEVREVHLGKKKTDDDDDEKEEHITLYKAIDEDNHIYASIDILNKFGITPSGDSVEIKGKKCYRISPEEENKIHDIARDSKNPKIIVDYENVKLHDLVQEETKAEPHVEAILDKLVDGVEVKGQIGKKYQASNIKVAQTFKDELHSGNYLYNIVHFVPAVLKAGFNLIRKGIARLFTSKKGKAASKKIDDRLHGRDDDANNITDEELEVLFRKYKGSVLKTDMNNEINPLILARLKEFILSKVEKINEEIKQLYTQLFTIIGEIKALEEKIHNCNNDEERKAYMEQLHGLFTTAAGFIRNIEDKRTEANDLLSSGIHGIEEDMKAVSTKLSYVGKRWTKRKGMDGELQHKLGEYGQGLNDALAANNPEEIVSNFMALEGLYYKNTEIKGSVFGKRSVGQKYYSPLAEEFDYRDDPFMKDLLTTIAVVASTVNIINAIRVKQIQDQAIAQQNAEAQRVNTANDATAANVRSTAQGIVDKNGTFREGMQAQAHQDVMNVANTKERIDLDMTDWNFGSQYHVADAASHKMWNSMGANTVSDLNKAASQYASGAITETQCLDQIAQISSSAQSRLNQIVSTGISYVSKYAKSHPQFDYTALVNAMNYVAAHPNAIANMNTAMVDVVTAANTLTGVQAMHMSAMSVLPDTMLTSIISGASAAALAMNVLKDMQNRKAHKNGYGNEVTDMWDQMFAEEQATDENTEGKGRGM